LAIHENLTSGRDKERDSIIINEKGMLQRMTEIIRNCNENNVIIDGHYAVNVVPKKLVSNIFVLRRDPVELRKLMEQCGFSGRKLWENLASEILDVCLVDALNAHDKQKVCELNISSRSIEQVTDEILDILTNRKKCSVGIVDWLSKLEKEGLLADFLKI
jgi:broad-specificity NMP kinase